MDLDSVMSIYAPDIVSFDVEPPLQHVGAEAKGKLAERFFDVPASARLRDSRPHDHRGR